MPQLLSGTLKKAFAFQISMKEDAQRWRTLSALAHSTKNMRVFNELNVSFNQAGPTIAI